MNYDSNILARMISGNCVPEEEEQLRQRLAEDQVLREEHEAYSRVWEQAFQHDPAMMEEGWDAFKAIVKAPKKNLGFDWLKVAASILLLAAFSVIIYFQSNSESQLAYERVEWPDATEVVLDAYSTVSAQTGYGKSGRNAEMSGHAHFKVASDPLPFVLTLNAGTLEVLGTEFSVLDREGSDFSAVELYEGSVRFTGSDGKPYVLKPGQRLVAGSQGIRIELLASSSVEWIHDKEIVCKDLSLEQLLEEVCLQYGLDHDLPSNVLKEHYTLSLPKDDQTVCIDLISALCGMELGVVEGQIRVIR